MKGANDMRLFRLVLMWGCAAAAVCGCGRPETSSKGIPEEQASGINRKNAILLDVRSPEEYAEGHLQGAVNIPHDRIGAEIAAVVPDKSAQVILYCRSGRRANTALETLRAMGYTNVSNYGGLEDAQERLGLPVITK